VDIHGNMGGYNFTQSRDGRTLFVVELEQEADLWLMDLKTN